MSEELTPLTGEAVDTDTASPVSVSEAPAEKAEKAKPRTKAESELEKRLKQMLEVGAHFGHHTRRWNPKMRKYIFTDRGGIHIIDLTQTVKLLDEAKQTAYELARSGKTILFLCTKKQGQQKLRAVAEAAHMPFVDTRWIGGLFTNFKVVSKRIKHLNEIKAQRDSGALDNMIKKERGRLLKQMAKLDEIFGGVSGLKRLPDLVFIVDPHRERNAIRECLAEGIPLMATLDTNCDPDPIDYPIPANDDAIRSINFILDEIGEAVARGRAEFEAKAGISGVADGTESDDDNDDLPDEVRELEEAELAAEDREMRRRNRSSRPDAPRGSKHTANVVITELKPLKTQAETSKPSQHPAPSQIPAASEGGHLDNAAPPAPTAETAAAAIDKDALPSATAPTIKKLQEKFGDLATLKQASRDDIAAVEGIGEATLAKIMADLEKLS
jgi:small subunit ribosomal protein S2